MMVNSENDGFFVGLYKPSVSARLTFAIIGIPLQSPQHKYPRIIAIMDALKAEIALKRKPVDVGFRPTKYMRRGDIERIKEEEEEKAKQERARAVQEKAHKKAEVVSTEQGKSGANVSFPPALYHYYSLVNGKQKPSRSTSPTPVIESLDSDSLIPESSFNISNEETIHRLRAKGQPIRLFAESDRDRRLRLRALELIEEKGSDRQSGQNDFKKALEDVENVERELRNKGKGKKKDDVEEPNTGILDLDLIKTDPDRLYPLIYYALKRTLKEWEEAMDERPGLKKITTSLIHQAHLPSQSMSRRPRKESWQPQPKFNLRSTSNRSSRLCVQEYVGCLRVDFAANTQPIIVITFRHVGSHS